MSSMVIPPVRMAVIPSGSQSACPPGVKLQLGFSYRVFVTLGAMRAVHEGLAQCQTRKCSLGQNEPGIDFPARSRAFDDDGISLFDVHGRKTLLSWFAGRSGPADFCVLLMHDATECRPRVATCCRLALARPSSGTSRVRSRRTSSASTPHADRGLPERYPGRERGLSAG